MGRWAEVYFASAPEKREQAVLDLLHELQAQNPASEAAAPASEQASRPRAEPAAPIAEGRAALVTCHACGRQNPASHRFCGMCGRAVAGRDAPDDLDVADPPVADLPVADLGVANLNAAHLNADDLAPVNAVRSVATDEASNKSHFVRSEDAFFEPPLRGHESPQPPARRDDTYDTDHTNFLDPAPASGSYRVHLVIGLAFVLLVLGYLTWRSMHAPESSRVAPQSPPAVTTQPEAQSATSSTPPNSSTMDTPDRSSPASSPAGVPSNDATHPTRPGANAKTNKSFRAGSTSSIPAKNPRAEAVSGSGGEELATAQHYLNGAGGQQRDSAEAAKWLWKAVAKHNGAATLLLADLYLKGDGVTKNCDQARVLLDAAGVKSVPGAAERLRNLQAFGCS
jgi:hypothetical protein